MEVLARRDSWRLFIAPSMQPSGIVGPLPPCIKNFRVCSARTGWGGTAKASFEFCAISTAVRVRAVWVHRDHQTTGAVSRWIS